ncbi:MAG: hypothetical protein AABZ61_12945 [Bacteroidota bacterium]
MIFLVTSPLGLAVKKSEYLRYIKEAAERGWKEYPGVIEQWKKNVNPSVLWDNLWVF